MLNKLKSSLIVGFLSVSILTALTPTSSLAQTAEEKWGKADSACYQEVKTAVEFLKLFGVNISGGAAFYYIFEFSGSLEWEQCMVRNGYHGE